MIKTREEMRSAIGCGPILCTYVSKNRRKLMGALFLISMAAMFIRSQHGFVSLSNEEIIAVIGWILVGAGVVVRLWAALYLAGHKNEQLITKGPYELVRNPLYTGNLISLSGIAVLTESVIAGLVLFFGTLLIYYATIRYEERKLVRIFGKNYRDYLKEVPRLLPRPRNFRHLLQDTKLHTVSYRNIRREFHAAFYTMGGAFVIHLAAEAIEYLIVSGVLT